MASRPIPSPRQLLTLGMFVFGFETASFNKMGRSREWIHATAERIGARSAYQFIGPGIDRISIGGLIVPEVSGSYSSLDTLAEMAGTGESYPLIDGLGKVLGHYVILALDEENLTIMAGGIPRQVDFKLELERTDDDSDSSGQIGQGTG